MKQKLKKMYRIFIICILILFSSCEKEADDFPLQDGIRMSKVSLKDPNIMANHSLMQEVQKTKLKGRKGNTANKIVYDSIYDFYFDDENGIYLEKGEQKSFTFPVYRENNDGKIENITFNLNEKGEYESYLVKYDFTEEQLQSFTQEQLEQYQTVFTNLTANKQMFECADLYVWQDIGHVHSGTEPGTEGWVWAGEICSSAGGGAGGSPGSGTGGSSGTGTTTDTSTSILITPVGGGGGTAVNQSAILTSLIAESFALSLTGDSEAWYNNQPDAVKINILQFIRTHNNEAGYAFVHQLIQNSIDSGLTFDIEKSSKSPAFIDMSNVSGNSAEEKKFNDVYNKLLQSSLFKKMFIRMFGVTNFINIKFNIADIAQNGSGYTDGMCQLIQNTNGSINNIITLDRDSLLTNSTVHIAQAIVHELIHAYLNVKLRHPSIGMPVSDINDMEFAECINQNYNGFNGSQSQHSFFVNFMIPTITQIFVEIKHLLFTPQQISSVEYPQPNSVLYATTQTIPSTTIYSQPLPWNWAHYFTHLSYVGLQNCSEYPLVYPPNSSNLLNWNQYITIGIYNFNP